MRVVRWVLRVIVQRQWHSRSLISSSFGLRLLLLRRVKHFRVNVDCELEPRMRVIVGEMFVWVYMKVTWTLGQRNVSSATCSRRVLCGDGIGVF